MQCKPRPRFAVWSCALAYYPVGRLKARRKCCCPLQAVEQRFVQYVQQHILPALTAGGGPAIIVSHGMAIKCFLRSLLGSLPTMSRQIALGNTAVTEVGWLPSGGGGGGGGNWNILSVNNLSHLPLEMRT